jgi:flagella basal body P-ring formation protein FlgA
MKRLSSQLFIFFLTLAVLCPHLAWSAVDREQEIRGLVTAFVTTRTANMGWDVSIRRITISDALKLPEGKIDYEIVAPQQWEGWGGVSLAIVGRQNDRILRNIPVRVEVEAMAEMVVTLHQIDHDAVITSADLALQKREITSSSHLAARTLDEIIGKKAHATLRANQPVRADQVEKVPLVKSGQMVTIIAENEVMKISVPGKARSNGAEGDTIRVQNVTSLKEMPARVINATTVQVAF